MIDIAPLLSQLDHEVVLRAIGLPVKGPLPQAVPCHACTGNLIIYSDPYGGAWCACKTCGFADDLVGLYSTVNKITSPLAAYLQMHQQGLCRGSDAATDGRRIVQVRAARKALRDFFAQSRRRIARHGMDENTADLLRRVGLYTSATDIPGWLGLAFRNKDVKPLIADHGELLHCNPVEIKPAMLVIPYYDLPGRIASLRLLADKESTAIYTDFGYMEHGLGMRELLKPQVTDVYALDHPIIATLLQRLGSSAQAEPQPIVTWTTDTRKALNAIDAQRVILWSHTSEVDALRAGASVVNGWVSRKPKLIEYPTYAALHADIAHWHWASMLLDMCEDALPWVQAARRHIFERPLMAAERAASLALRPQDMARVEAVCTAEEIQQLRGAYVVRSAHAHLFGEQIEERVDGYWLPDKSQLISGLRIIPERLIDYGDGSDKLCIGKLIGGGTEHPFRASWKRMNEKPWQWLRETAIQHKLEVPAVTQKWQRRLVQLATALHPPIPTEGATRVGFTGSDFIFPQFRVSTEETRLVATEIRGRYPAANFTPTDTRRVNQQLEQCVIDDQANAVFWRMFMVILRNLMAPMLRWTPRLIGVRNTMPLIPQQANLFASVLELLPVQNVKDAAVYGAAHDLPAVWHAATPADVEELLSKGVTNVIVPVSALCGRSGALYDNWTYVDIPDGNNPRSVTHVNSLRDFMPLVLYRAHHELLTANTEIGQMIALILRTFEVEGFKDVSSTLLDILLAAGNGIRDSQRQPLFVRFLRLVSDALAGKHLPDNVIEVNGDRVTVHVARIREILRLRGALVPPVRDILVSAASAELLLDGNAQTATILRHHLFPEGQGGDAAGPPGRSYPSAPT